MAILPRDSAGSFELKEGTGPITGMCACGDFLEIYKIDKTFRVRTPESVDPERTNPNAMWTASPHANVGSSNLIVSRVLLQSNEILKVAIFEKTVDNDAVILHLHSCKEALIACELTALKVISNIDRIIENISARGVSTDNHGRGLNPFPQVRDLEIDCGTFLIHANRAIKIISELPSFFLKLDKQDSNFEHLAKRLKMTIGNDAALTNFVVDNSADINHLVELRNFHEHPKNKKTTIDNFRLMPNSSILPPQWMVSGNVPRLIKEDMLVAINFLTTVAELIFIHLVMQTISKNFPYIILAVPENEISISNPIRYTLSLDVSKMNFPQ